MKIIISSILVKILHLQKEMGLFNYLLVNKKISNMIVLFKINKQLRDFNMIMNLFNQEY